MRVSFVLIATMVGLAGCAIIPAPSARAPARVVVVNAKPHGKPRTVGRVPPGHFPPPGQCRIWYAGRPAGHQPRAVRCNTLMGRVPRGAFILYNASAWDADYDWRGHAKQHPGSVPDIVIRLTVSSDRD